MQNPKYRSDTHLFPAGFVTEYEDPEVGLFRSCIHSKGDNGPRFSVSLRQSDGAFKVGLPSCQGKAWYPYLLPARWRNFSVKCLCQVRTRQMSDLLWDSSHIFLSKRMRVIRICLVSGYGSPTLDNSPKYSSLFAQRLWEVGQKIGCSQNLGSD